MQTTQPLALLGGLSPQVFMKRHWQKKPLVIRQAITQFKPLLVRAELFDLAAHDHVESRLVVQGTAKGQWRMKTGPLPRRALPPVKQANWTLLVQGMDLHHDGVRALMDQFRFVPDARLDDVMISYATAGGGVGPHFDSYDVFLLQAQGRREWKIGRQKDLTLQTGVPLKILANFEPEETFVLEPGDMLYLPPRWAHDGVALDECMTYSIGFRAPNQGELARELLMRLADDAADEAGVALYKDAAQAASDAPGLVPEALHMFAQQAVSRALKNPLLLQRALGEWLTEPKASVWFDEADDEAPNLAAPGVALDRKTKMMFDALHVFINGESFRAGGRDAVLMQKLANQRMLLPADLARLSAAAKALLAQWKDEGWLHAA
jgi:50S ribosomal protein L16 3-hydroxylase